MIQNKLRPFIVVPTLLALVLVVALGIGLSFLYSPLIKNKEGIRYTVRTGSSIQTVIDELSRQNILSHSLFFKWYVRIKGVARELKAGEYLFPYKSSFSTILKQIITGYGLVYQSFTIVPGWTFKEILNALQKNTYLRHTLTNLSNQEIMTKLGHPELVPEGEFFPDTYHFAQGTDDMVVLRNSFKDMQNKLKSVWKARAVNLPFKTPYEALIGASIIEKEAFYEEELPVIAGVMVNRLRKGMFLQFDPTVLYGLDREDRTIHKTDLRAKTPYNTYVFKGLPPTPISMPSFAALQAITHPAQHDYYYFVAEKNKSSLFTKKLSQHHKAILSSKKTHWTFNLNLERYYLSKIFSQPMRNTQR